MKNWKQFTKKGLTAAALAVSVFCTFAPVQAAEFKPVPDNVVKLQEPQKQAYITDKIKQAFNVNPAVAMKPYEAPDGYTFEQFKVGNVTVDRFAAEKPETERVLLQMHGGAYVLPMRNGHRFLGARQAMLTKAKEAYYVDYRVAPDNVYPAALEDAVAVYKALLEKGIKPENIMLVGDSAGGNLAVELALYLRDHKIPQPAVIMVASPWGTLEHKKGTSRYFNDSKDQVLGVGTPLNKAVKMASYAGKLKRKDPRLSPVYADLRGLSPLLIQTGGNETLLTENIDLAKKAVQDGVEVTLTVYPGMPHDFALMLPDMEQSVNSLYEMKDFANRYMK